MKRLLTFHVTTSCTSYSTYTTNQNITTDGREVISKVQKFGLKRILSSLVYEQARDARESERGILLYAIKLLNLLHEPAALPAVSNKPEGKKAGARGRECENKKVGICSRFFVGERLHNLCLSHFPSPLCKRS